MKPPRLGDIVEVEWVDSQHIDLGWVSVKEYTDAAKETQGYRTAGYFIAHRKHLLIGQSLGLHNGHMTNSMSIPRKAVTKIKVLGRASAKVRKALSA